jgi:hypothetical protein
MFGGQSPAMFSYAGIEGPVDDALADVELQRKFNGLDSDPYRELDETTRGVPMGQPMSSDSFWLSGSLGKDPLVFFGERL